MTISIATRTPRRSAISLVALLPALLLSPALAATTLARMSIEEMSHAAPVIVRAICVSNRVVWDSGEIWTFTSFDVTETWRGSVPARIAIRLLGGTSGNLTSIVAGVPRFAPGDDVVLFLEHTPRGDFSILSWAQGTFRVEHHAPHAGATVTQATAAVATYRPKTRRFETTGIRNMPLAAFRARVQAALAASAEARQ